MLSATLALVLIIICTDNVGQCARFRVVRDLEGSDPEREYCENTRFYCPNDNICKPREQRCIGAHICDNPRNGTEYQCDESSADAGKFKVLRGHSRLGRPKRSTFRMLLDSLNWELEHQFITFRGFTYEFGRGYGVQVLDILDPNYKYINGRSLNERGIEVVGESYCTYEDAMQFVREWRELRGEYSVFSNNCQHFADKLLERLTAPNSHCNRARPSSSKSSLSSSWMQQWTH